MLNFDSDFDVDVNREVKCEQGIKWYSRKSLSRSLGVPYFGYKSNTKRRVSIMTVTLADLDPF